MGRPPFQCGLYDYEMSAIKYNGNEVELWEQKAQVRIYKRLRHYLLYSIPVFGVIFTLAQALTSIRRKR